ncbi:LysM peptidoglycan-binding domain-containing protein [Weissella cibaria]|uniref:LysM peptidoglycan-binding domain-containing protein n=1 Tax=Weissella cibaria TaxID=137591 RepID=UPI00119312E4|nr:LysM domain-containing protein [Weissella cibaria]MCS8561891.1 LysM peptidoglycan-binding domain-containing protein [Weissella cibaria]MCS8565392.1 LysM peptidoglycan-binding domain-containing protein [Weissella cibaria]MCS8576376.1 LysM peptidoglycan-binding domain-containing protein [Weissella cibaria]MCS9999993.1 LysM peptidoglycan-binding domain-containing protein [Weissella cibaria]MDK9678245.1 LysM peptidoglycan-binding domain-containing protein [Weissella cibaria]
MNKKMITALAVAGMATFALTADASADTYTVQSGDTLSQIAANHSTTIDTLVANNAIANANLIYVGEQLEIDAVASNASYDATQAYVAPVVASQAPVATEAVVASAEPVATSVPATVVASAEPVVSATSAEDTTAYTAPVATTPVATTTTTAAASGSTYDQFIAAGGTDAMWTAIVMPESGGNVDASNGQYHGLGQTNQSWGYGSVSEQTSGMLNYATSRYGSVDNAIAFRAANGWW